MGHRIGYYLEMAKAYVRQWVKGIEIVEIIPGLYQSSHIRWPWDENKVKALGIDVVIDLSGGFDTSMDWLKTYLYWPIKDEPALPNAVELDSVAEFGAWMLWNAGYSVLTHCTGGFNRSGLVNAMILNKIGISGKEALRVIRSKRPGALSNNTFAYFVSDLQGTMAPTSWMRGRG